MVASSSLACDAACHAENMTAEVGMQDRTPHFPLSRTNLASTKATNKSQPAFDILKMESAKRVPVDASLASTLSCSLQAMTDVSTG